MNCMFVLLSEYAIAGAASNKGVSLELNQLLFRVIASPIFSFILTFYFPFYGILNAKILKKKEKFAYL